MKEKLPSKAVIMSPLPENGKRYRTLFIVPKRDFGTTGFLIKGKMVKKGWVVTDGMCNIMPGATWFQRIPEAKHAIDTLIAVDGDADMFWEIMHPFRHTPGEKHPDDASFTVGVVKHGRHYAIYKDGVCTEVGINPAQSLIAA